MSDKFLDKFPINLFSNLYYAWMFSLLGLLEHNYINANIVITIKSCS